MSFSRFISTKNNFTNFTHLDNQLEMALYQVICHIEYFP
ncbi:hypothetical protein NT04LS_3000 [Listeria seeligeri FSL S4-171]|uniref:Uncharacterized protein n=1 Tax=Listeria seeligeri FSL N1-067 TaxID=702453 RepID=E3ZTQ0_LISSE|nr:hypothetical protein NT03LS_2919 [Listeria seeligeri FSL N1-067]EFS02026.1 hypothetical protein NT04LS_3000 [Listeria seeligeri FSL S4-171]